MGHFLRNLLEAGPFADRVDYAAIATRRLICMVDLRISMVDGPLGLKCLR